jgi:hypothetical protein
MSAVFSGGVVRIVTRGPLALSSLKFLADSVADSRREKARWRLMRSSVIRQRRDRD